MTKALGWTSFRLRDNTFVKNLQNKEVWAWDRQLVKKKQGLLIQDSPEKKRGYLPQGDISPAFRTKGLSVWPPSARALL